MVQLLFTALTRLCIDKRDVLIARVIIHAYNHHVRLLSPEPLVVNQPQSTRVQGADIVMKSSPVLELQMSGEGCRFKRSMQHHLI